MINTDQVLRAVEADDMIGICIECGFEQGCVEPDARDYQCEDCGASTVFGAQELLFEC